MAYRSSEQTDQYAPKQDFCTSWTFHRKFRKNWGLKISCTDQFCKNLFTSCNTHTKTSINEMVKIWCEMLVISFTFLKLC